MRVFPCDFTAYRSSVAFAFHTARATKFPLFFRGICSSCSLLFRRNRAYRSTGDTQRDFDGRFVTAARCFCSLPASTRYDPRYWTIALCVDLHTQHAITAFGSASRGNQRSTGRPCSPAPAASTAGRHSGWIGRLSGDTSVSAATTAAIVARVFASRLSHRRIVRFGFRSAFCRLVEGGSFDFRRRACFPRRACRLKTFCYFAGCLANPCHGPSSVPRHVARLGGKRVGLFLESRLLSIPFSPHSGLVESPLPNAVEFRSSPGVFFAFAASRCSCTTIERERSKP